MIPSTCCEAAAITPNTHFRNGLALEWRSILESLATKLATVALGDCGAGHRDSSDQRAQIAWHQHPISCSSAGTWPDEPCRLRAYAVGRPAGEENHMRSLLRRGHGW